jgi:hypothetical protein
VPEQKAAKAQELLAERWLRGQELPMMPAQRVLIRMRTPQELRKQKPEPA